jgi:hypothetical protein
VTDSLDDVLMQVMADAKHEYRNPKEVAALVRHVQGEANRRRMAKIEADDRAIATFVETSTPAAVAGLVEHAPDLQRWAPMVKAYPLAPHVTLLHRDQPAVAEQAVKLVATVDTLLHGHTRSITSVAQNHVTHGCRLIRGAASETDTGATINAESPCFVDGFCSCTYRGRTIRNIRNSMHGCLKIFFPQWAATRRQKANEGKYAIRLSGARAGLTAEQIELYGTIDMYFHIADMSWSPFGPELQRLEAPSTEYDVDALCASSTEVGLVASVFLTEN